MLVVGDSRDVLKMDKRSLLAYRVVLTASTLSSRLELALF